MLHMLLPRAVSHPGILPQWSVRMKQSRRTKQKQLELLFEAALTSQPTYFEVPMTRKVELTKTLAQLLLDAARGNAKVVGGVDRDA